MTTEAELPRFQKGHQVRVVNSDAIYTVIDHHFITSVRTDRYYLQSASGNKAWFWDTEVEPVTDHFTHIVAVMPEGMPESAAGISSKDKLVRDNFAVPEAGDLDNGVMRYYRGVANAIFDPKRWKNPVIIENAAKLSQDERDWIELIIVWFHGIEPTHMTDGRIASTGYAAELG